MAAPTPAGGQIEVLWQTAGSKLIQDPDTGEIKGVVGLQNQKGYGGPNGDTEITIKAKRAVVMCTGGFEFDEERKRNFLRAYPSWYYTNPNNSGEGIRMGQAVGADLWHMNVISGRAITYHEGRIKGNNVSTGLPFFIVNKKGERWWYETPWPSHNAWLEFVNCSTEDAEEQKVPKGHTSRTRRGSSMTRRLAAAIRRSSSAETAVGTSAIRRRCSTGRMRSSAPEWWMRSRRAGS